MGVAQGSRWKEAKGHLTLKSPLIQVGIEREPSQRGIDRRISAPMRYRYLWEIYGGKGSVSGEEKKRGNMNSHP